eukprot:TRINITY_DN3333_c1_g1_i1.p1 TRINITY_DN3333_c1_g1~~TRINITY_DN3333_c1_g1_i1.p1  ORF type:complete len:325 (-),score=109.17 TRINITY_DN3333_c1_g1_i1:59-1033(-)
MEECPICNTWFELAILQEHVDFCLSNPPQSSTTSNQINRNNTNTNNTTNTNSSTIQHQFYDEDLQLALRLQDEERASSSRSSCQKCQREFNLDLIYILDECGHRFCHNCVKTWVESAITKYVTVSCELVSCKKQLSIRDMQFFFPKKKERTVAPSSLTPITGSRATGKATERLLSELTHIINSHPETNGYSIEPINDNLYHWEISFLNFEKDTELYKDMQKMKIKKIKLHAIFPSNYPHYPPFIRVIKPRFTYRTGHVTIGGSICMELLTNTGWSPATSMEAVIMTIRTQLIDGGARLDFHNKTDYTEHEATDAFNRMVQTHGW